MMNEFIRLLPSGPYVCHWCGELARTRVSGTIDVCSQACFEKYRACAEKDKAND